MMGVCQNCGTEGETQTHHIVPRSRGGRDLPSNLVNLCLGCHGKAHDVVFTNEGGLVAEGMARTKKDALLYSEAAALGADDGISDVMEIMLDHDADTHFVLLYLLERRIFAADDLARLFIKGEPLRNRSARALWSTLEEAVDAACKAHAFQ